jgi:hypothetical protein
MLAVMLLLYGLIYRYATRGTTNEQIKQGVIASFTLTRTLSELFLSYVTLPSHQQYRLSRFYRCSRYMFSSSFRMWIAFSLYFAVNARKVSVCYQWRIKENMIIQMIFSGVWTGIESLLAFGGASLLLEYFLKKSWLSPRVRA